MILKTYISNIFKTVQGLDLLDAEASHLQEARALLLPISESAIYSCSLIEEQPLGPGRSLSHLFSHLRSTLPSPEDTSDEEDEPANRESARPPRSTSTLIRKPGHVPLVLLQQTPDDEKFAFGSSPKNHIVLKSSKSQPEICYVNLQHCVLYPNPDDTSITLHNPSGCEFSVRNLEAENNVQIVKPGSKCVIPEGAWHLNLGIGFDFQINVLRHSKEWNDLHNALMKSVEISTPYQRHAWRRRDHPTSTAREERLAAQAESQVGQNRVSSESSTEGHSDVRERPNAAAPARSQPQSSPGEAVGQTEPPHTITLIDDEHITGSGQMSEGKGREKLDVVDMEKVSVSQGNDLAEVHGYTATAAPTPTDISHRVGTHERTLGETTTSRVVKRTVADSTVRAVKICRHPDEVTAAKAWRTEASILQSLNHVRLALF